MKIIVCHNFYQQPGGEDQVFADETALLESRGHAVIRYTVHNDSVNDTNKLALTGKTIWNAAVHHELKELVARERADVVHFHNTFPLISPAAYYAARSEGAAVVHTLHNFRLLCANGLLFREGKVCEECVGRPIPWPSVVHACYRGDRAATAVTAALLTVHRAAGTYEHAVDAYIALTEFSRTKYLAQGVPADRIVLKPNFVSPDPGVGQGEGDGDGPFALFVGRLTVDKGIEVLLKAWEILRARGNPIRLKILGDGPLSEQVRAASNRGAVQYLGRKPMDEVQRLMGRASFLVFPSIWYEGMPKTMIESFAKGTPILASNLGSMAEMVAEGRTGALFSAGDANALATSVIKLLADPVALAHMRLEARREYDQRYTADANYLQLLNIYQKAMARRRPAAGHQPAGLRSNLHRTV